MKDKFGREINYLRVSLTDRCNLRCRYCMPEKGIDDKLSHKDIISLEDMYLIIKSFADLGINKVRFTGGEPLIRKGIVSLINKVSQLKNINDIAMTTNGILLEDMAKDLKDAGLNRLNISLDTLDKLKYKKITRGGNINKVLNGIKIAENIGLTPIKINTVLIGGFNTDEIIDLVELTSKGIDVRFIELMPIGEARNFAEDYFVSNDEIIKYIPNLSIVQYKDKSSPAKYYRYKDYPGKVGIINPISCKFCDNCNRVRLTSSGLLKTCLHSNKEIDLKPYINNEKKLKEIIRQSILNKEESHNLEDKKYIDRNMNQIGG